MNNKQPSGMVSLEWITSDAEKRIVRMARVSNPANQDNSNIANLISHCVKNKHWSIFEMANMCLEIQTTRAIAPQILRHRSFTFQEFSQRYAPQTVTIQQEARRQDSKNRQNSIDDLTEEDKSWFSAVQNECNNSAVKNYQEALDRGIAKECARALLPLSTYTRMYMNGTIRSWIHYIDLRCGNGTQFEHQQIAEQAKAIFRKNLPTVSKALGWDS